MTDAQIVQFHTFCKVDHRSDFGGLGGFVLEEVANKSKRGNMSGTA